MNKRQICFFITLTVLITALILLVAGSPLLVKSISSDNNFPLGTIITWAGIVCLPLSIYLGIKQFKKPSSNFHRRLVIALKLSVTLSLLWIFISYLLAGNFSFTFTEKAEFQGGQTAMKWFWRYTYGVVILPLILIITYWISLLFNKK